MHEVYNGLETQLYHLGTLNGRTGLFPANYVK